MAQTNTGKLQATINENGEAVYQAPIEIKSDEDLANYGITKEDCRTLHFGKSEKIIVYYFPTTNKRFAEEQWKYLNTQHSKGYRSTRCMVPGKQKPLIVCPDTNKCTACPYGRRPEDRLANVISWDGLIESGHETNAADNNLEECLDRIMIEKIKKVMDEKNTDIFPVFALKIQGYEVSEIAHVLGITERRVYYCMQQVRVLWKKYC